MEKSYYVVDAFASEPFTGNPAAVVLNADGIDDARMQTIAAEFNLSETTFVLPPTAHDQRSPAQTGRPVEAGRQSRHDTAACHTSTVRPLWLSDKTWPTHATVRVRRHAGNKPAFISVQCRGAVAKPATSAFRETQAVRGQSPTHRLARRGKAHACTTLRASHARP